MKQNLIDVLFRVITNLSHESGLENGKVTAFNILFNSIEYQIK